MQEEIIQVTSRYEKVNILFGVAWKSKNKKQIRSY
jgi:hypothetical protein